MQTARIGDWLFVNGQRVYAGSHKPDCDNVSIPKGMLVTHIAARVAHGARKPKGNAILGGTSPRDTAMPTMLRGSHEITRANAQRKVR